MTEKHQPTSTCHASGDGNHVLDAAQERCVHCGMTYEKIVATALPDRPIQAGDWVECVDGGSGAFVQNGQRYLVERLSGTASWSRTASCTSQTVTSLPQPTPPPCSPSSTRSTPRMRSWRSWRRVCTNTKASTPRAAY